MIEKLVPFLGVIKAALFVALLVACFAAGVRVEGWRKDADIAKLNAAHALEQKVQADGALKDLTDASKKINDAAASAAVNVSSLGAKLDAIQRGIKNAPRAPLPVDCKPDAGRMRDLSAAADALREAIAGQRPGKALPVP